MKQDGDTERHTVAASRFRFVDGSHRDLFDRLAAWSNANCTCAEGPEKHIMQSYVAATFCAFCAPPQATDHEVFISAKCGLLFFLVDDGSAEQLDEFDRVLGTGMHAEGNEPATCLASLFADLEALGCDTGDLDAAVRRWVASMRHEQDLDIRTLTPQTYYDLRKETIFVSCLVFSWTSLLRTRVAENFTSESMDVLDFAIRIVIIANDLGSLRADDASSDRPGILADINTVLLRGRVLGLKGAVREAIDDYNTLVTKFQAIQRGLPQHAGHDGSGMSTFLAVLRHVVNGNLDGTRHLTKERYPGSSQILRRLDSIAPSGGYSTPL